MTSPDDELALRAARRAFIRAHHPDVGGDASRFADGLAGFVGTPPPADRPRPTVTAFRSRTVGRSLQRSVHRLRRRLAGLPPRRLL